MNLQPMGYVTIKYTNPAICEREEKEEGISKKSDWRKAKRPHITLELKLSVNLTENHCIELNIERGSMAGFSDEGEILNEFNRGVYMDTFSSTIQHLSHNSECIYDSRCATDVKSHDRTVQQTYQNEVGLGLKGGSNTTHPATGEIGPSAKLTSKTETRNSTKESEFRINVSRKASRRIVSYKMNFCENAAGIFVRYDVTNISPLRDSKLSNRLLFGFLVPLYGWFGGWNHFPDVLYRPPACSSTSLQFPEWQLKYKIIDVKNKIKFTWSAEIHAIIASITGLDCYNWRKTVHKVIKTFEIVINDNKADIKEIKEKCEQICSSGKDDKQNKPYKVAALKPYDF